MAGDRIPASKLRFHPATPLRWKDVERVFGERGGCGQCWCMAWRLRPKEWVAGKSGRNKKVFKKLVSDGTRPGVIAYLGREPIAWCAVAPREAYSFLERSRVYARIDDKPVWSVSCLVVRKPYRRRGVAVPLLRAAVDFAASRGARIVEGYPVEAHMEPTPDVFIWTGVPSIFRKAGFKEAVRRSRTRAIMRRTIRRPSKRS